MASAASMVRGLWVMTMNCVFFSSARSASTKRPTLVSSRAASTSSRTQTGDGCASSSESSSASAVSARSPPERMASVPTRLPRGEEGLEVALKLPVDDGEGRLQTLTDVRLELVDGAEEGLLRALKVVHLDLEEAV